MAKFGENYRAGRDSVLCPLWKNHKDSQEESFRCTKVRDKIKVEDKYDEIFDDNHINLQRIATVLADIESIRDKHTEEEKWRK